MNSHIKTFIEQNIDLIESKSFTQLYAVANQFLDPEDMGKLTAILLDAGIDPQLHLSYIPVRYYSCYERSSVPSIPSNITAIQSYAFYESDIEYIFIPSSVENIFRHAFDCCTSLTSVVLDKGVEFIGEGCFIDCIALSEVQLPKSLVAIEGYVFSNTPKLTVIHYDGTCKEWDDIDKTYSVFYQSCIKQIICSDGVIHL